MQNVVMQDFASVLRDRVFVQMAEAPPTKFKSSVACRLHLTAGTVPNWNNLWFRAPPPRQTSHTQEPFAVDRGSHHALQSLEARGIIRWQKILTSLWSAADWPALSPPRKSPMLANASSWSIRKANRTSAARPSGHSADCSWSIARDRKSV